MSANKPRLNVMNGNVQSKATSSNVEGPVSRSGDSSRVIDIGGHINCTAIGTRKERLDVWSCISIETDT